MIIVIKVNFRSEIANFWARSFCVEKTRFTTGRRIGIRRGRKTGLGRTAMIIHSLRNLISGMTLPVSPKNTDQTRCRREGAPCSAGRDYDNCLWCIGYRRSPSRVRHRFYIPLYRGCGFGYQSF